MIVCTHDTKWHLILPSPLVKIKHRAECKQTLGNGINSPQLQRALSRNGPFEKGDGEDSLKRAPADLMQTDNDTIKRKQSDKLKHLLSDEPFLFPA